MAIRRPAMRRSGVMYWYCTAPIATPSRSPARHAIAPRIDIICTTVRAQVAALAVRYRYGMDMSPPPTPGGDHSGPPKNGGPTGNRVTNPKPRRPHRCSYRKCVVFAARYRLHLHFKDDESYITWRSGEDSRRSKVHNAFPREWPRFHDWAEGDDVWKGYDEFFRAAASSSDAPPDDQDPTLGGKSSA